METKRLQKSRSLFINLTNVLSQTIYVRKNLIEFLTYPEPEDYNGGNCKIRTNSGHVYFVQETVNEVMEQLDVR